jgi:molybdopterin/thiamine biosynthesis adenylyltransferase
MSDTDELRPWWERRPERLRWELTNFADAGLTAELRRSGGSGDPLIHTAVTLSDGREIPVRVSFPFEYPLTDPKVKVDAGLIGPPHEVGGSLCLLDNPGAQWHPQRSAAELVEHARGLLEAVLIGGPDAIAEREEQVPEPTGSRFLADKNLVILVPDPFWAAPPDGVSGGAIIVKGEGTRRLLAHCEGLGDADTDLESEVLCSKGVALGRWAALDTAPRGIYLAGSDLLESALEAAPQLLDPFILAGAERPPDWVAITYPEEGPRRGEWRRGWTSIEITADEGAPTAKRIAQTQALTAHERQLRLPELVGLADIKVVMVGVGSLGSRVAVELAKAGVGRLSFFDDDIYDVNNAVRHEMPIWLAGAGKALGMVIECHNANPFVKIDFFSRRVGAGRDGANEFLREINDAHLVIETTGSRATTRVVQRYCGIAGVPLLNASLTRGSRGGDMMLVTQADCFDCFLLAQENGEIPKPDATEQELVVPIGCADPAFSGAGFDAASLGSDVARMAVRAVAATSYPALDHNWAVANFVVEPRWRQGTLAPDDRCGHSR